MFVEVPVSVGELIDKVTILRIKAARIDAAKRTNVERERALLEGRLTGILALHPDLEILVRELEAVNATLWDVEEGKRRCEREQDFGPRFIALARTVYIENDRRAAIKKTINLLVGSAIVEEKSHAA